LRRAIQKYIEDPLSEALIQGSITTRPAFIEIYLENDRLFYRPVGEEKHEGVLLYSN
jgi:ATP-dependent Clp protease ATP-binding subunit ClpC